jgi:signal transduction histidine kinase
VSTLLRSRALRDALVAGAVVLSGGFIFVELDAVESVTSLLRRFERLELDDLLLTSALAVAAATWFALRRLQDSRRQLRELQASEADKARYVARLEELSAQLLETEQRERSRLADALHDSVGQTLYACGLALDRLGPRLRDREAERLLASARDLTDSAIAHTRDLTADLSPPILHDLGLCEAIEWLLGRLHQRFELRAKLVPGEGWDRIPQSWHEPVFHSVRELLVNAGKHAGARHVEVSAVVSERGQIEVRVADDGRGFVAPSHGQRGTQPGFGLLSIERRMACLGAALEIESAPSSGTRACLRLPCGN